MIYYEFLNIVWSPIDFEQDGIRGGDTADQGLSLSDKVSPEALLGPAPGTWWLPYVGRGFPFPGALQSNAHRAYVQCQPLKLGKTSLGKCNCIQHSTGLAQHRTRHYCHDNHSPIELHA